MIKVTNRDLAIKRRNGKRKSHALLESSSKPPQGSDPSEQETRIHRLGVVSFLNSRPLIEGLDSDTQAENTQQAHCRVSITKAVPARLAKMLDNNQVDAALVPVIDVIQPDRSLKIVSDACIGCNGETLTVRIFSKVAPADIQTLHVDGDSHTSVALARIIWQEMFDRELEIKDFTPQTDLSACEAILLIGDKVINNSLVDFDVQTDLGGAWKSFTGLPFVFAVWAAQRDYDEGNLGELLSSARDAGVANAVNIAADAGPGLGWPVQLAERYLTRRLNFKLTERHIEGLNLFLKLTTKYNIVPGMRELVFA